MRMRRYSNCGAGRSVFAGLTVLVIGTVYLLFNFGIWQSEVLRIWWPLLLIVIGAAKVFGWWYRPRRPYSDFA
jgi:hypothetical protein